MSYTFLQRQELALGKENLSKEALDILEEHDFNYLQMRTLRQAMENGLSIEDARQIAQSKPDVASMEECCGLALKKKTFAAPVRKRYGIYFLMVLVVVVLVFLWNIPWPKKEPLTLHLVQKQIHLPIGMQFEPENYVRKQDIPVDAELLLPSAFTAVVPEMRLVAYEVRRGQESVRQIMEVTIVDETKPILELKSKEITLLPDAQMDWRHFIAKAYDAVDGDLYSFVHIERVNEETVRYYVQDRSGNMAEAMLKIQQADLQEETKIQILPAATAAPSKADPPYTKVEENTNVYEESSCEEEIIEQGVQVFHHFSGA